MNIIFIKPFYLHRDSNLVLEHICDDNSFDEVQSDKTSRKNNTNNEDVICDVCCNENPVTEMIANSCSHEFCRVCWNSYLRVKIFEGLVEENLTCAQQNCSTMVDENLILDIIREEEVLARYYHLVTWDTLFQIQN